MGYSLPPVLQHIESLGYRVFTTGVYNLNLFGIRGKNRESDQFDDLLGCAYKTEEGGGWHVRYWPATTDPGAFCLKNPTVYGSELGTAIYKPGQYRGVYEVGMHRGKYLALVQTGGPIKVYRDADRDTVLDMNESSVQEGYFGCNVHKAGEESTRVGRWSAGCQVHATEKGHLEMMGLVELQLAHHPTWKKITYSLLDQWW